MTQQLAWDELLRHFGVILGRTSAQSDGIPARGDKQGSSAKAEADAQCDLQLLTFEI